AVFTSTLGTVTTTAVTLTVLAPLAITQQPVNQAAFVGQSVTFTAVASGTAPRVQWQGRARKGKTDTNIIGATAPTLGFVVSAKQKGYLFRAVFTNAVGQVISSSGQLVIW